MVTNKRASAKISRQRTRGALPIFFDALLCAGLVSACSSSGSSGNPSCDNPASSTTPTNPANPGDPANPANPGSSGDAGPSGGSGLPLQLPPFCADSKHSTTMAAAPGGEELFKRWTVRAKRWPSASATFEKIHEAFLSVEEEDPFRTDPGSWTYELRAVGCEYDAQGVAHDQKGEVDAAIDAYRTARQYYDIARFPFLATKEREDIYHRMVDLYLRIGDLSGAPAKELVIPMGQDEIRGFLRLPKGVTNPPIIVMTGGLDTWRTSYDAYALPMNDAGFATFVFDMPGVGLNTVMLSTEGHKMYQRVVEYFSTYAGIDGTKIGVYTGSFAGAIGLQLALVEPKVKAVVDNSGGVHHLYVDKPKLLLPKGLIPDLRLMQQAILWTCGFRKLVDDAPLEAYDVWTKNFPALSLVTQGILKATPGQAPLLHIHGGKDDLIPIEDYKLVGDSGIVQQVLFYPEDDHMAPQNFADHHPKAVQFFKEKLAL